MTSKYFILSNTTRKDIIGPNYPQSYGFVKNYNPNEKGAIFDLYKYKTTFPDFTPNLEGIKLSNSAKLTDFISNCFGMYIVSSKVKIILEKYNLCPHRFYSIKLYHKKEIYNYYMLKIISNYSDYVDYLKSTFVEFDYINKLRTISIDSLDDLLAKRKKIKNSHPDKNLTIWVNDISFNEKFDQNIDFFEIGVIDGNTYISTRLCTEFDKNNITGIDLTPINFDFPV